MQVSKKAMVFSYLQKNRVKNDKIFSKKILYFICEICYYSKYFHSQYKRAAIWKNNLLFSTLFNAYSQRYSEKIITLLCRFGLIFADKNFVAWLAIKWWWERLSDRKSRVRIIENQKDFAKKKLNLKIPPLPP